MHDASSQALDLLTLQFLSWLDGEPRSYGEVMDGWRSSCPRLTVWEDATGAGLVAVKHNGGTMRDAHVVLTPKGRALLAKRAAAH